MKLQPSAIMWWALSLVTAVVGASLGAKIAGVLPFKVVTLTGLLVGILVILGLIFIDQTLAQMGTSVPAVQQRNPAHMAPQPAFRENHGPSATASDTQSRRPVTSPPGPVSYGWAGDSSTPTKARGTYRPREAVEETDRSWWDSSKATSHSATTGSAFGPPGPAVSTDLSGEITARPQAKDAVAGAKIPGIVPLPLDLYMPTHRLTKAPYTARSPQCPRCGSFRIVGLQISPASAFECRSCENKWSWQKGTPWPMVRIDPRLLRFRESPATNQP